MIKEMTIYLIASKDCPDCADMKEALLLALGESSANEQYELKELTDEDNEAIDIAIDNDINDLPACVIGSHVFCGKKGYTYAKLLDAIEAEWEELP